MPKVAGRYGAVVKITKTVAAANAESKEAAIRIMLLELAAADDNSNFQDWVNGGMETVLLRK